MSKILINTDNAVLAWQTVGGGWNDTVNTTVEVEGIPDAVKTAPSGYYCYTDGEFSINPDYTAPTEPTTQTVEEQIAELFSQAEYFDNAIAELMFTSM